jgi:hypothetical protein
MTWKALILTTGFFYLLWIGLVTQRMNSDFVRGLIAGFLLFWLLWNLPL